MITHSYRRISSRTIGKLFLMNVIQILVSFSIVSSRVRLIQNKLHNFELWHFELIQRLGRNFPASSFFFVLFSPQFTTKKKTIYEWLNSLSFSQGLDFFFESSIDSISFFFLDLIAIKREMCHFIRSNYIFTVRFKLDILVLIQTLFMVSLIGEETLVNHSFSQLSSLSNLLRQ